MKTLLHFIMISLIAFSANAFELQFEKKGDKERIIHKSSDWHFVGKENNYFLSMDKSMLGDKKDRYEFHSVTEFYTPYKYQGLDESVHRIYTYGLLDCSNAVLHLMLNLYVDVNNTIVYREYHQLGSYTSPLIVERSVRKTVYDILCRDSV